MSISNKDLKVFLDSVPAQRLSRSITMVFLSLLDYDKELLLDESNKHLPADMIGLLQFLYVVEDSKHEINA